MRIADGAVVAAAKLSQRYIVARFLPDKAIDLLDEACAVVRVELDSEPAVVRTPPPSSGQTPLPYWGTWHARTPAALSRARTLSLSDVASHQLQPPCAPLTSPSPS